MGHGTAAGIGVTVLRTDFVISGVKSVAEGEGLSGRLGGLGGRLLYPRRGLVDDGGRRDEKHGERRQQAHSGQSGLRVSGVHESHYLADRSSLAPSSSPNREHDSIFYATW